MSKFYKKRHFYALVLPMVIFYTVFEIYPILYNVVFSFTNAHGAYKPVFSGLSNYKRLLTDPYFGRAILNTLTVVGVLLLVLLPSSFFLAYTLNRQTRLNNTVKTIIFLPYVISAALTALVWYFILNPSTGLLNNFLELIGLGSWRQAWINGPTLSPVSYAIIGSWAGMGFYIMLWQVGLRSIPTDVLEAGLIDGTSKWQQIRYIILPMMKDITGTILIFIVTGGLKTYEYVDMLTGGGPLYKSETVVSYMYTNMFVNTQHGYGMTMAVVLFAMAAVPTLIIRRLSQTEKL